jgi:hypothetical protein
MNEELFEVIKKDIIDVSSKTVISLNEYLNTDNKNKTQFQAVVRLLTIKIMCEKGIQKFENKNKQIIELNKLTEEVLQKSLDNMIMMKK